MGYSIIEQLANDNYIVVNKTLIKQFGLEEAVLLGELCSEYNHWAKQDKLDNNMFYSTMENIEENTGLSPYQQRSAIQSLVNAGILRTELKGMPAVKWFEIDEAQLLKNLTTRCEKTSQQDVKKLHLNNNKNNNKKNISKDILQDVVTTEDNLTKLNSKLKSKGKNLYQKCLDLINDFTDNEELRHSLTECFKLFSENSRDAGMPFYANNFKGKLNTLAKLSTDTEMQIKIVQQTLDSGWQNFYAIKGDIKRKSSRYTTNEPTDMGYVVDRANRRGDIRGEKF